MGDVTRLAAHCLGRPILMEPRALAGYAARLRDIDAHAFERPGRVEALLRKLSFRRTQPVAMEDDEAPRLVPLHERLTYSPRYIGEPDDTGYCWALKNGIAMMAVTTPITDEGEDYCGVVYHGYDTLLNGMAEAWADGRVKAIFLKMKTPGGVAAPGITALTQWMRGHRAAAGAGGKPIWVYADMMCSAGMWIGAQGDKIIAAPMGYVGSVGAYTLHEDDTGFLDKAGIVITEIKFGAKKTDGAPWKKLSDGAKADIQAEIDQLGNNFLSDMVLGRPKMTREALLATEAAAFFAVADDPARSGLALGFVDEIMTEEEAFAALLSAVSSPAIPNLPVAAPAGGAKTESEKEQPMAMSAEQKAARLAALNAEEEVLKKNASAHTARLAAIAAAKQKIEAGEEPGDDEEDEEGPEKPKDSEDTDEGDGDNEDEAAKISASAEAQKHPHLALAAISTGQTFDQFQANVKAQANAPKSRGALAEAMSGSPRLSNDAGPVPKDDLNAAAIYEARRGRR